MKVEVREREGLHDYLEVLPRLTDRRAYTLLNPMANCSSTCQTGH